MHHVFLKNETAQYRISIVRHVRRYCQVGRPEAVFPVPCVPCHHWLFWVLAPEPIHPASARFFWRLWGQRRLYNFPPPLLGRVSPGSVGACMGYRPRACEWQRVHVLGCSAVDETTTVTITYPATTATYTVSPPPAAVQCRGEMRIPRPHIIARHPVYGTLSICSWMRMRKGPSVYCVALRTWKWPAAVGELMPWLTFVGALVHAIQFAPVTTVPVYYSTPVFYYDTSVVRPLILAARRTRVRISSFLLSSLPRHHHRHCHPIFFSFASLAATTLLLQTTETKHSHQLGRCSECNYCRNVINNSGMSGSALRSIQPSAGDLHATLKNNNAFVLADISARFRCSYELEWGMQATRSWCAQCCRKMQIWEEEEMLLAQVKLDFREEVRHVWQAGRGGHGNWCLLFCLPGSVNVHVTGTPTHMHACVCIVEVFSKLRTRTGMVTSM